MLRRGLASSPPVASYFHHVVVPNPSCYSVMQRPMFLPKPISYALWFFSIKIKIRAFLQGGFLVRRLEIDERKALS